MKINLKKIEQLNKQISVFGLTVTHALAKCEALFFPNKKLDIYLAMALLSDDVSILDNTKLSHSELNLVLQHRGGQANSLAEFRTLLATTSLINMLPSYYTLVKKEKALLPKLARELFVHYKDSDTLNAVYFGDVAAKYGVDESFAKVLTNRKLKLEKNRLNGTLPLQHLLQQLDNGEVALANAYFEQLPPYKQQSVAIDLFKKLKVTNPQQACHFIANQLDGIHDVSLLKQIAARLHALKQYDKSLMVYSRLMAANIDNAYIERAAIALYQINSSESVDSVDRVMTLFKPHLSELAQSVQLTCCQYAALLFAESANNGALMIDVAPKLIEQGFTIVAVKLSKFWFNGGDIAKALSASYLDANDATHAKQIAMLQGFESLRVKGFVPPQTPIYPMPADNNNVLYTLYNSLPVHSAGYATRAHGLMLELRNKGFDINAMTRLGYPHDLRKFRDYEYEPLHRVDGVEYHHLLTRDGGHNFIPLNDYLTNYANTLIEHAKANNISLLHSASNFVNGTATNYAAKALGLKSIYEVRGLWEVTRMSRQPEWKGTAHYEMTKRLETESAMYADHVIAITQALKDEMISRGVDESKITVVPNGVDTSRFSISPVNHNLKSQLGFEPNDIIIGYVGSMVDYEGLDLLIQAASILKLSNTTNFKLMLVGDGAVKKELEALVTELSLEDIVLFTGRIPHDAVEDYYSITDICPLPRKGLPVCEMVSPLKPFEAMAMGKTVVASDVAALAEIVQDGKTGLLHKKDDADDLARTLLKLIKQPELCSSYGLAAREWVIAERDWKVLANRVEAIYLKLLS